MDALKPADLLDLILNEIIPPSEDGRVPGAGQIGVGGSLLAGGPRPVKNCIETVTGILDAVSAEAQDFHLLGRDGRVAALKTVERRCPGEFGVFVRAVYMDYYSRPEIRPLFGVGSHPVHPEGYPVEPESEEVMARLTEPVRSRGPCFRRTGQ